MERLRHVLASPLRIAVIPADPQDPFGSLGDLAMLTGLRAGLCATHRKVGFTVLAARSQSTTVPGIGHVRTVAAWNGNKGRRVFEKLIRRQDGLFVMGADVLDGKYCDENVQRVVSYCNRAVSDGVPTTILGCSYNKNPSRTSIDALALLHPDVLVNARDNLSLNRLRDFVGAPARLSADIAFLVPPGVTGVPAVDAWIARERAAQRILVGVNINAHALAPVIDRMGAEKAVVAVAEQLSVLSAENSCSYLLIPHDFKPGSGDVKILRQLEAKLRESGSSHVRYAELSRPSLVKAMVARLDVVLTARMHLAIAALGVGTPVLSIGYQDKFEGLYEHFGLDHAGILTSEQVADGISLRTLLGQAIESAPASRLQIETHLPEVVKMAFRNLELPQMSPKW